MGAHAGPRPFGNLPTLLQFFRGASAIFGLRNEIFKDVPVIRVRRVSDNEEQDFTTNEINDGTLVEWVGSGTNAGFLTVWYDNTKNGNHAVQTDTARQPVIVSNGEIVTGVDVSNTGVYLDIPAIESEGSLIAVTSSGSYRLGVNLTGGVHRIYTYHIWGIELLLYYEKTLTELEYEQIAQRLELLDFNFSDTNFGADWTNAFRDRSDIVDLTDLEIEGVTSFSNTFQSNSTTSVPENLFANNPNVTTFRETFRENSLTSVPENLFANNPNVTDFSYTFRDNSTLTSVPENLFANNPNVTTFQQTFQFNSTLTDVPAGLFDNQTLASDYQSIFGVCALTESSVDNVLVSVNNSAQANDITNGRIDITGGSNSPPSGTGDTAITALIEKGWTVNVNS